MKGDYRKQSAIVVGVILIIAVVVIVCIRLLGGPSSDNTDQTVKDVSNKENVSESDILQQDDSAQSSDKETVQDDEQQQTKDQMNLTVYAQIVQQYEQQYGQLTFYKEEDIINYTGVFLIEPVDFDKDGVEELVIGYATAHPDGPQYCTWPALDVWSVKDEVPVRLYEGACVTTGDIVRQCGHVKFNGNDYLITGYNGSGTNLKLLELKNGSFITGAVLKESEDNGECSWNDQNITVEEFLKLNEEIYSQKIYYASVSPDDSYTTEELITFLNQTRKELGLDEITPKVNISK